MVSPRLDERLDSWLNIILSFPTLHTYPA